jgi:hypothetical protein
MDNKDEDSKSNESLHSDNSLDQNENINEYLVEVFKNNTKLYECTYKVDNKEIITELDIERREVDEAILKKGDRIRIIFNGNRDHTLDIFIHKYNLYYLIDIYTTDDNKYVKVDEYTIAHTLTHTNLIIIDDPYLPIRRSNSWCSIM